MLSGPQFRMLDDDQFIEFWEDPQCYINSEDEWVDTFTQVPGTTLVDSVMLTREISEEEMIKARKEEVTIE